MLSTMKKGVIGTEDLNRALQAAVNPPAAGKVELTIGERIYRQGDKVLQVGNNYNKHVLNRDIGVVVGTAFPQMRGYLEERGIFLPVSLGRWKTIWEMETFT